MTMSRYLSKSVLRPRLISRVCVRPYVCICILVAPRFKKSFKIRSWVPSPQMPYFKTKHRSHAQHTQHRNHHTTEHMNKTHDQTT